MTRLELHGLAFRYLLHHVPASKDALPVQPTELDCQSGIAGRGIQICGTVQNFRIVPVGLRDEASPHGISQLEQLLVNERQPANSVMELTFLTVEIISRGFLA